MSDPNLQDRQKYAGMTTNERLFEVGTLSDFNAAMQAGDIETIRRLLLQVYVDEPSIELTIQSVVGLKAR